VICDSKEVSVETVRRRRRLLRRARVGADQGGPRLY
jgi:hypothetical protein